MNINDAIEHCYAVAKNQCEKQCGEDHTQLAKWLEELVELRKKIVPGCYILTEEQMRRHLAESIELAKKKIPKNMVTEKRGPISFLLCPECKELVKVNFNFCPKCGIAIKFVEGK